MTLFEQLERARTLLTESEDTLRGLRDQVDTKEQQMINKAIGQYLGLRDQLWEIDKAIAKEGKNGQYDFSG